MGVSVKFIGNPKEFAKEVKKDFGLVREGVSLGLADFMASALEQVAANGFMHVYAGDALPVLKGKSAYPEAPGMNVKSRDRVVRFPAGRKNSKERVVTFPGRKVFAAGKVVSRKGRLPADLQGIKYKSSNVNDGGQVAWYSNGKSSIRVFKMPSGFEAQLVLNPKNMLAWLGFECGRGVAGSMTVVLEDGSTTTLKGKVGQRRIIHKGLVQGMKVWNKAAQGKLEQYMKRKSRNAK